MRGPRRRRMDGHGDVHDPSSIVGQYDEHEEQAERHRRHDEEGPRDSRVRCATIATAPTACRGMYLATVDWLTEMPSFSSSPWIRGAPQSGLAAESSRVTPRTSSATGAPFRVSALPPPEQPKATSVPADDGLRFHHV
jgi:hypothetical protein